MKSLFEILKTQDELAATSEQTARINALKEQLAASDYKVIKSAEFTLVGEVPPYDLNELHEQREALRAEINTLEAEIEAIKEQ